MHAPVHPALCHPTTRLAVAGNLADADADKLIRAERIWRTLQGMLRITLGRDAYETRPAASEAHLLRACAAAGRDAPDMVGLRADLDNMAVDVRTVFTR
ncbi:MAG: hypothetical protein EXR05_09985 [Acetobacteraceae bacterium]|nr:hypothetical protein [Acetobacteraceae bacterium]MSP29653.1 hypothetical protein [Acetobacteraceae bacterium]